MLAALQQFYILLSDYLALCSLFQAVEEMWVLSMLSKLSHSTSSSLQVLEADLHLSRLLAHVGLHKQAAIIIDRAEKGLYDVTEAKRSALVSEVLLGKCCVLLYSGQVSIT